MKKPPPKEGRTNGLNTWDDVGAAWDETLDGERGDDEISWASDGDIEGADLGKFKFGTPASDASTVGRGVNAMDYKDAVGPLGEARPYAVSETVATSNGSHEGGGDANGRGTPRPLGAKHAATGTAPSVSSGSGSGVRFITAGDGPASEHPPRAEEEPPDSGTEADEDRDTVSPTLDKIGRAHV